MSQQPSQQIQEPYRVSTTNLFPTEQDIRIKYATGYINAGILKWIAFLFSVIYYLGAVIFPKISILTTIGYSAFPMFAFFISEGYENTHDKFKYGLRLWGTGILTQIPYILCFLSDFQHLGHIVFNPILTYALGYTLIWNIDFLRNEFKETPQLKWIIILLTSIPFYLTAYYLPIFHGIYGISIILLFWILREDFFDGAFVNWIILILYRVQEMWSLPGFLIIGGTYNHKKGNTPKWLKYLSFPVLLTIYWGISYIRKGGIS